MRSTEGVIHTFITTRKTRDAIQLAQRAHLITTPCENFVRIGLVTNIPDDTIFRRIENVMQGDG